jgi:hypothetical protein
MVLDIDIVDILSVAVFFPFFRIFPIFSNSFFQNTKTMSENETVGAAQVLVNIVFFMPFQLCRYLGFSSFYIYVLKVVLLS